MSRIRVALFILVSFLLFKQVYSQDSTVQDVKWDEKSRMIAYTLSEGAFVKIRVGKEGEALYQTLVNWQKRSSGRNQEQVEVAYKNPHFCVSASASEDYKDLNLLTSLKQDNLTINLNQKDKSWFMQEPAELKVYLDDQLILAERINSLPHTFSIKPYDITKGKHLFTINLWQRPEYLSCAYKNLELPDKHPQERIAFCQFYRGYWQVWTVGLNGRGAKVLTESPVDKRYPCFSPDGEKIAYVTNTGELWIMDSDGRNDQKIPLSINCYEPKWSSDGKRLVFTSYEDLFHSDSKIWILDLETRGLTKIASRPFLQYNPSWSADGNNIIFIDGPELYAQQICKLDLSTGDVVQVTDTKSYVYKSQPQYLPDGKGIVYACNQDGDYDIWIMDKIGSEPKNLTAKYNHGASPVVSRSGREIFFISGRPGTREIWQISTDGNNLKRVTHTSQDKRDISIWTKEEQS